jgi:FixJ family two-component response regulator
LRQFSARPEAFVLVVVDLMMPGLGGEEVVRGLRSLRSDVRVVLSSGYAEADATQRFEGAWLQGFIQKPYRYATLVEVVRSALHR